MWLRRILQEMRADLKPPLRGLMVRSAILWGLGDVGAQAITNCCRTKESEDKDEEFISFRKKDTEFKIHWWRVCTASAFGVGASIGPLAYYRFIKRLQRSTNGLQPSAPELVGASVVEGLLGTLNIATFFPYVGFFGAVKPAKPFGHGTNYSVEQAKEDFKRGFTRPVLVLSGVMVPAKLITVARFVPVPYQLHCASLFCLVGSSYLSWTDLQQHKDDTAAGRSQKKTSEIKGLKKEVSFAAID